VPVDPSSKRLKEKGGGLFRRRKRAVVSFSVLLSYKDLGTFRILPKKIVQKILIHPKLLIQAEAQQTGQPDKNRSLSFGGVSPVL